LAETRQRFPELWPLSGGSFFVDLSHCPWFRLVLAVISGEMTTRSATSKGVLCDDHHIDLRMLF